MYGIIITSKKNEKNPKIVKCFNEDEDWVAIYKFILYLKEDIMTRERSLVYMDALKAYAITGKHLGGVYDLAQIPAKLIEPKEDNTPFLCTVELKDKRYHLSGLTLYNHGLNLQG